MKFKFVISKNVNFYFFLHNLAKCEWPWPYRSWNNEVWKKELGNFTQTEKKALQQFKKIYKNYFLKVYLGKSFLAKNPWKMLEKEISQKEVKELKNIFFVWKKKFEEIYKKDLLNLRRWKEELTKEMKKPNRVVLIDLFKKTVENLYRVSFSKDITSIYLILCGRNNACGGERGRGLENSRSIFLELSRRPLDMSINYVIGVIFHEITHNYSRYYVQPLLFKVLKNKKKARRLEELINRSLTPIGIFSIKFLDKELPSSLAVKNDIGEINSYQTIQIINLTAEYIRLNKSIDVKYIKKLIEIL